MDNGVVKNYLHCQRVKGMNLKAKIYYLVAQKVKSISPSTATIVFSVLRVIG